MYEQPPLLGGFLLGETAQPAVDEESLVSPASRSWSSLRSRHHRRPASRTPLERVKRRGNPGVHATRDDVYDPDMDTAGTRTVPSFVDACLLALVGTALIAGVASAQPASGFYLSQEIGLNVRAIVGVVGQHQRPTEPLRRVHQSALRGRGCLYRSEPRVGSGLEDHPRPRRRPAGGTVGWLPVQRAAAG